MATELQKLCFHSNPKERQAKEFSNYRTIALISHDSKVMIKILQARLLQYVNWELPDAQARFRKGRGTRDQTDNIGWIIQKAKRIPEKHLLLLHWLLFGCVDHNKLWKILQEMRIPDHFTCLLRNLYAGQETTVRIRHGTRDWFLIRKGVRQTVYCHPAYLTYMLSTSWRMLGWMNNKLESRLQGEILTTSEMQMISL